MKMDPLCPACQGKTVMGRALVHANNKMDATMQEFAAGKLHSGSKTGPKVTNRKQALAIGFNQQQKASGGY